MGNLLIRDVDEAIIEQLKAKAKINGTSLQHEASEALKRGSPVTGAQRRAILTRFEHEHGFPKVSTDSVAIIRAVRDGEEDDA